MAEGLSKEQIEKCKALLVQSGSVNQEEAMAAQTALAAVLQPLIREGVLVGNTISEIFKPIDIPAGSPAEFPIDLYRVDNQNDFVAYTIPVQGKIPQRQVGGDYLQIPTYDVGNAIDWLLRYAREARWDIVTRSLQVLEAGFVKKMNDDGHHVLLAAAYERGLLVNDSNAAAGQFTKRLVSSMKLIMRRNGGGNSTSSNRVRMTHLLVSPEAIEDMRNWDAAEVDELTRRELYIADDEGGSKVFGVNIVTLDEYGEGQEYQDYYEDVVANGAANDGMAAGDEEVVLGLDLSKDGAFVMPVKEKVQIFSDPTLHRERRGGYYGWTNYGLGALSTTHLLLGSM